MLIDILSLFPGYFKGPFDESIVKQARKKGILDIRLTDIRDFAELPHKRVDDRPYGGGPGMVMMPKPTIEAIRHVKKDESHVVYLSPQGKLLNAAISRRLAQKSHLILLCGHYEGIDQRILENEVHEEISIGDYVLTNGCLPAIVLVDSVVRFIPGVLGDHRSANEDSFERQLDDENDSEEQSIAESNGYTTESKPKKRGLLLDCPHYTRPEVFEGQQVPAVLLSGNHEKIKKWREEQRLKKTAQVRPELLN